MIQQDLKPFLRQIKDLGYAIKLDTNGTYPVLLAEIIQAGLVDYIAMDVKAPLNKYRQLSGVAGQEGRIKDSIRLLFKRAAPL